MRCLSLVWLPKLRCLARDYYAGCSRLHGREYLLVAPWLRLLVVPWDAPSLLLAMSRGLVQPPRSRCGWVCPLGEQLQHCGLESPCSHDVALNWEILWSGGGSLMENIFNLGQSEFLRRWPGPFLRDDRGRVLFLLGRWGSMWLLFELIAELSWLSSWQFCGSKMSICMYCRYCTYHIDCIHSTHCKDCIYCTYTTDCTSSQYRVHVHILNVSNNLHLPQTLYWL